VLVGNLPYSISGRLLGELLVPGTPFRRWGFLLQTEVAERLLAAPGSAEYGILTVWTRLLVRARRALELGPGEFVPRPKVRSTFLVLDPLPEPPPIDDWEILRRVVHAAFRQRRKTLRRALSASLEGVDDALREAGIDPRIRGEGLSELDFARLANAFVRIRG
jgi:16S rRNA (adenine1518-N6/adenine1519-N6)-dimethyltransferase